MRMRTGVLALAVLTACGGGDSSGPKAGPPAALLITAGGGAPQLGAFGQAVPVAPTVLVTDASNLPVPNVTVSFVATGGGTVDAATKTTGSNGSASVVWTLGNTFGQKTLNASVAGLPSVTFTANAIAPDAGVLAFNLVDPAGDTIPGDGLGDKGHDLVSLRGDFKRDSIIVTASFNGSISSSNFGGAIEFDIDDNPTTGVRPFSNDYGTTANLGIEYQVDLFSFDGATMLFYTPSSEAEVKAVFSTNALVIRIPMTLLGNDDGNFGIVGIVGTAERPTDIFPNSGAGQVRRNALLGGSFQISVKNPGEERNHVRLDPSSNSLHMRSWINRSLMWNRERGQH